MFQRSRFDRVWVLAGIGAVFYWLSLPPCKQPWAAFIACAFWTAIVAKDCPLPRRDYWNIWFVSCALWLALLQGIRLANPMLYPGWVALSLYVAAYLPLFVGIARSLRASLKLPLAVSVGIAWVSCELVRAYFVTGFSACMLAHSQTPWPFMLPLAAHLGGYGVSLLVMVGGAVLYGWVAWGTSSSNQASDRNAELRLTENVIGSIVVVGAIAGSAIYLTAHERSVANLASQEPLGRFLIIQEHMPTIWDGDPNNSRIGWERYEQQTYASTPSALTKSVDAVLWPESTFSVGVPWIEWDGKPIRQADGNLTAEESANGIESLRTSFQNKLSRICGAFGKPYPHLLVGSDVWRIKEGEMSILNSALWIDPNMPNGVEYYAKQHLVMFGEYIPVFHWFPEWCSSLGLPLLTAGDHATAFQLASGTTLSTTICFEDVVPHMVRSNIVKQTQTGKAPDILVNLTNDAWFRGSSILDHHLNNAILAAVENRRPMLVAANHGISAWIDGNGRVIRSLRRLEGGSILAQPIPDGRWGVWQMIGDWPARIIAMIGFFPLLLGLAKRILQLRALPVENRS
ncbi:MAG: apolipoprotein N-acyltransferase [Pirellula sp.]